ncbi:MAG: hypothetical protein R6X10_07065 [Desulfobacterales bacterium]
MKRRAIFAVTCVLLILMVGTAGSDELADLQEKVDKLEEKTTQQEKELKDLEKKQSRQEQSIKRMRKKPSPAKVVSEALGKRVTIGGHFKFFLADFAHGERNGVDQNNNLTAGVDELWLYFNKQLTDWLSLDVAPTLRVSAGATPSLGSDIVRPSTVSIDLDLDEAYMTLRLPYRIEAKAGAIYPYFSEDYASRVWWHELYHANNGLVTLENWQSTGIELYRNFNFETFSLPIYFYPYLNGLDRIRTNDSRFTDNNANKHLLLHVAPVMYRFGGKIRLFGSFGWGVWDDEGDNNSWQFASGMDLGYKGFSLMGEYMAKIREDWELADGSLENADDTGWYVRLMYTFNSDWRAVVKYSDVDLFYPGTDRMLEDNYKSVAVAVNYWLMDNSTIIPQIEYVDSSRSDNSEELDYFRYTLGWRTTF